MTSHERGDAQPVDSPIHAGHVCTVPLGNGGRAWRTGRRRRGLRRRWWTRWRQWRRQLLEGWIVELRRRRGAGRVVWRIGTEWRARIRRRVALLAERPREQRKFRRRVASERITIARTSQRCKGTGPIAKAGQWL